MEDVAVAIKEGRGLRVSREDALMLYGELLAMRTE
jgi:hypothetical protein